MEDRVNKAYVGVSFYGVDIPLWSWFLRSQINTIKRMNKAPILYGEMPSQLASMFFAHQTGQNGFVSEVMNRFDDLGTGEIVGGFEGVQFSINKDMPTNEIRVFLK